MPSEISAIAALGWIGRGKAIAKKSGYDEALNLLTANRLPERIKAAISAGPPTDATLAPYGISIGDWSDSARTRSAFYRILADGAFVRLPPYAMVSMVTTPLSAAVIGEGKATPVDQFTLSSVQLMPEKVGKIIVCYDSFLREVGVAGQQTLNRALLGAVSDAADKEFLTKISAGATPIASTATMADLRAALLAVNTVGQARLYWISSPDVAKLASTLTTAKGGAATVAASAEGGELVNLPMLVSTGVPAGSLYLVDASEIAVDATSPSIEASSETDIEMSTTPTSASDVPTPTSMVSMFGTNSTALKPTAYFACQKLRANAIAIINNITTTTWAS